MYLASQSYQYDTYQHFFQKNQPKKYTIPSGTFVPKNIPEDDFNHGQEQIYKYEYSINNPQTGDYKNQHEERIGDSVRGSYSLIEPDGRRRIVEYTADAHNGFKAIVKHERPSSNLHTNYSYLQSNVIFPKLSSSTPQLQIPATSFIPNEHSSPITVPIVLSLYPKPILPNNPKSTNLYHTLPQVLHKQSSNKKNVPCTTTSSPQRYYRNLLRRFNGWPFIN